MFLKLLVDDEVVDPEAGLADVLARNTDGEPVNRIEELSPWRWTNVPSVAQSG